MKLYTLLIITRNLHYSVISTAIGSISVCSESIQIPLLVWAIFTVACTEILQSGWKQPHEHKWSWKIRNTYIGKEHAKSKNEAMSHGRMVRLASERNETRLDKQSALTIFTKIHICLLCHPSPHQPAKLLIYNNKKLTSLWYCHAAQLPRHERKKSFPLPIGCDGTFLFSALMAEILRLNFHFVKMATSITRSMQLRFSIDSSWDACFCWILTLQ